MWPREVQKEGKLLDHLLLLDIRNTCRKYGEASNIKKIPLIDYLNNIENEKIGLLVSVLYKYE